MRTLGDIPIRHKLAIIIMVTTATALLLTGIGVVAMDNILYRATLRRELIALGSIVADNSTAALAFNDPKSATETLGSLHARAHVISACINRLDGTVLAAYVRPGSSAGCPRFDKEQEFSFSSNVVTLSRGIDLTGRRVGTLALSYDLGEVNERLRLYGGLVFAILLFSSMVAYLLASRLRAAIATPISELVRATKSVAETGDYAIRAPKLGHDELGVLVDRFNEMLAGIQSRDTQLTGALHEREIALSEAETARERFRFLAESMPQKIFTTTPSGEFDYFNRQWMEFSGLSFEELRSGWIQLLHPEDEESSLHQWRHAIESGEPFHIQHRFRRADGSYRWHLSRAHAMRDAEGRISMWIGSSTDIHEQKEKQEELERANEDLQQFAYSASHDLQEPIRNVVVYSEVVTKRYHSVLDDDGKLFLGFMIEGGRRLAMLVNDLLAYTRAGVLERSTEIVPAAGVLSHVLLSLAEAIRESGAVVTWDELPEVPMGEAHLQQVLQNLIGNAIKYRAEVAPRIHISASRDGLNWRFSVEDNGIGIESVYKEKIFGVFKRLHRDEKYAGTGIGLAICQRVVGRYGGRIWVESSPGKGSIFYFTIPEQVERARTAPSHSSVG